METFLSHGEAHWMQAFANFTKTREKCPTICKNFHILGLPSFLTVKERLKRLEPKLKKVNGQDLTTVYRKLPPRDKDGGSQLEQQLFRATTMRNTVAGQ